MRTDEGGFLDLSITTLGRVRCVWMNEIHLGGRELIIGSLSREMSISSRLLIGKDGRGKSPLHKSG